jgi:hypothetical protein
VTFVRWAPWLLLAATIVCLIVFRAGLNFVAWAPWALGGAFIICLIVYRIGWNLHWKDKYGPFW